MFLKFSDEAQKLLLLSLKEKNNLNDSFIGTEHIFLAILSMEKNCICKLLNHYNIFYDSFFSYLVKKEKNENSNFFVFTPLMNDIFKNLSSNIKKNSEILIIDIIVEMLNNSSSKVIYILRKMGIDLKNLLKELSVGSKKKQNLKKGILYDIGINLNEKCLAEKDVLIGRDEEIDSIIEVLCCKNKNNPILIGDAGVGKTAIVEELARRISLGNVPFQLKDKKIFSVTMSSLVAGTKYRGEFEEKINKLIMDVENSEDIILFIDEIHTLVGAGGADGAIDASNILKPSLARGKIKIIGATTKEEYDKYFSDDKALSRRFKMIMIDEPSILKVKEILFGIKSVYESFHNVVISENIIEKIVYYSDKYLKNKKFPDKAIDILDEVCVLASFNANKSRNLLFSLDKELNNLINLKNNALLLGDYKMAMKYSHDEKKLLSKIGKYQMDICKNKRNILVTEEILMKVMERKTNIPFYKYKYEKSNFLKLLNKFENNSIFSSENHKSINRITLDIFHNLTTNNLSNALVINSCNFNINNYFISDYLNMFFNKCNLIQVDINNFKNIDDFLGVDDYYNKKKTNLIDKVRLYPFSIIVINNFNSADISIKEFLLNLNKYGYYLDKRNEKIDFSNVLFIYNNVNKSSCIGFNNLKNIVSGYSNCIELDCISEEKLNKKIKNICIEMGCKISKNLISVISNKIIFDSDNLKDIDYLIKLELSKLEKNNVKAITMKV